MLRRALPCLLVLVTAGCALQPPAGLPALDRDERRAVLLEITRWEARGRIAVRMDETGGQGGSQRGGQGNLRWTQDGDTVQLRLSGPFGAGAYEITWDPVRLTIVSRDGSTALDYAGPDAAERFLAEQLGWSFPVASSRYWLRGLADPASPALETFDEAGRLAALEQHAWRVRYEDYVLHGRLWLPRKLVMENPHGRVRLVVDAWEPGS